MPEVYLSIFTRKKEMGKRDFSLRMMGK